MRVITERELSVLNLTTYELLCSKFALVSSFFWRGIQRGNPDIANNHFVRFIGTIQVRVLSITIKFFLCSPAWSPKR